MACHCSSGNCCALSPFFNHYQVLLAVADGPVNNDRIVALGGRGTPQPPGVLLHLLYMPVRPSSSNINGQSLDRSTSVS